MESAFDTTQFKWNEAMRFYHPPTATGSDTFARMVEQMQGRIWRNPDYVTEPSTLPAAPFVFPTDLGETVRLYQASIDHSDPCQTDASGTDEKDNTPPPPTPKGPALLDPLPRGVTFGFEMTGITPRYEEVFCRDYHEWIPTDRVYLDKSEVSKRVTKKLRLAGYVDFNESDVYADGHCLEYPSPVFKTSTAALRFYRTLAALFQAEGVTPHHPITVCGGNHLHFGFKTERTAARVTRDLASRYFLPWVFTQPDDTESCNNLLSDRRMFNIQERVAGAKRQGINLNDIFAPYSLRPYYFLKGDSESMGGALYKPKELLFSLGHRDEAYNVLEIRCVEAPKDETEFADQFNFFNAYVKWAGGRASKPVKFISQKALQAIKPRQAIKAFRKLCRQIGVDPRRYDKYIKRNLLPRWKLKRKRY